jgi:hypothetical protein
VQNIGSGSLEIQVQYVVRTFVNDTTYPQYNNKEIKSISKKIQEKLILW